MSDEPAARDVLAHVLADRGYMNDDQEEVSEVHREAYLGDADAQIEALAAAGWRLKRDDQSRWTGDARRCEVLGSHKPHTNVAVTLQDGVPIRKYEYRCNGGVVTTWVQEVAS